MSAEQIAVIDDILNSIDWNDQAEKYHQYYDDGSMTEDTVKERGQATQLETDHKWLIDYDDYLQRINDAYDQAGVADDLTPEGKNIKFQLCLQAKQDHLNAVKALLQ